MKKTLIFCLSFILTCTVAFAHPEKNEMLVPSRDIPKLHLTVPFFGLGTVELGRQWGIGGPATLLPEEITTKKVLRTALQHGWRVIDTASSYGISEIRIGNAIPQSEYQYLLITKPGEHSVLATSEECQRVAKDGVYCAKPAAKYDFSRAGIFRDVENSLAHLKVKKIDVLLLHLNNQDAVEVLNKGEAVKALQDLRAEGKAKYIGVSVNGPATLQAANMQELDFLETEYSLLNQTNAKAIEVAHQNGLGVIVRGGLGTGLLTASVRSHLQDSHLLYGNAVRALVKLTHGDYNKLTALALAFLYQNPNISTVIIGADTPKYIEKDIQLLKNFKDQTLLVKAIKVMANYTPPKQYTENMGEFYLAVH